MKAIESNPVTNKKRSRQLLLKRASNIIPISDYSTESCTEQLLWQKYSRMYSSNRFLLKDESEAKDAEIRKNLCSCIWQASLSNPLEDDVIRYLIDFRLFH